MVIDAVEFHCDFDGDEQDFVNACVSVAAVATWVMRCGKENGAQHGIRYEECVSKIGGEMPPSEWLSYFFDFTLHEDFADPSIRDFLNHLLKLNFSMFNLLAICTGYDCDKWEVVEKIVDLISEEYSRYSTARG